MTIIKLVDELFADADYYRNYGLIKTSSRRDDDVAKELNKMLKKITIQMKEQDLNGKDPG